MLEIPYLCDCLSFYTMKILITGAAGFIGAAVTQRVASAMPEASITGLDNINNYYAVNLKTGRLAALGILTSDEIEEAAKDISAFSPYGIVRKSSKFENLSFVRMNLQDKEAMDELFLKGKFDIVINLAAQAGVRYSIENPRTYIESNIDGFMNVLEGCRQVKVKHLIYASSSSVYGLNGKVPFSESDGVAHPVSLYAATKKANELMAHTYSHLYSLPVTGLRFFTVYGPWGRPDMSPFLFIDAILQEKPIKVFNNGEMLRDFTYIDDIVEAIFLLIDKIPTSNPSWDTVEADPATSSAPYRILNIGNSQPVNLKEYIKIIEEITGKNALKIMMPMQPGDVYRTFSDSSAIAEITGFRPSTTLKKGLEKTIDWYKKYFRL